MSETAVDIEGVTHYYGGVRALRDVSLSVASGTRVGLLGPNGGGKTTLFRILSTLLKPSEGSARVFGFDVATQPAAVRCRLGTIFQHTALDGDLTVLENLRFQGALYGLHGAALRHRIDGLLEAFGVSARARDRVKTLSGGLQRRVDLARGLLHRPALLLLDEPTLDARVVGGAVQISHAEAHTLLAALYEAFGGHIESATVRRPTLEDVFMIHAGHRLDEHATVDS